MLHFEENFWYAPKNWGKTQMYAPNGAYDEAMQFQLGC
jgi:hypothetical protein